MAEERATPDLVELLRRFDGAGDLGRAYAERTQLLLKSPWFRAVSHLSNQYRP